MTEDNEDHKAHSKFQSGPGPLSEELKAKRSDIHHDRMHRQGNKDRQVSQPRHHKNYSRHKDRHLERNNNDRSRSRDRHRGSKNTSAGRHYEIVPNQSDANIHPDVVDPRDYDQRMTKQTNGRNTESFDPSSTLVRPDIRVHVVGSYTSKFPKLKHDDVVIIPELFGKQDDWTLYYKLVEEMTDLQKNNKKGSEWIPWHEGAHLIIKNPEGSSTFEKVIDTLCEYFSIRKSSIGTRFNWYKDSADWKPFHHDSAAFNPQRAKNQNITVGVSFGATRELAFIRAEESDSREKVRLYFPQTNNGVFSFGRDVNIRWKVRVFIPTFAV
jgi:hypothetical protein